MVRRRRRDRPHLLECRALRSNRPGDRRTLATRSDHGKAGHRFREGRVRRVELAGQAAKTQRGQRPHHRNSLGRDRRGEQSSMRDVERRRRDQLCHPRLTEQLKIRQRRAQIPGLSERTISAAHGTHLGMHTPQRKRAHNGRAHDCHQPDRAVHPDPPTCPQPPTGCTVHIRPDHHAHFLPCHPHDDRPRHHPRRHTLTQGACVVTQ